MAQLAQQHHVMLQPQRQCSGRAPRKADSILLRPLFISSPCLDIRDDFRYNTTYSYPSCPPFLMSSPGRPIVLGYGPSGRMLKSVRLSSVCVMSD